MDIRITTIARCFVSAFLAVGLAAAAFAGEFTRIPHKENPKIDVYAFRGTIEESDVTVYESILTNGRQSVLFIDSGGGNFLAGIKLGRLTMKYRDMVTIVVDQAHSAAALWALGDDNSQFLNEKSRIGFHLPYRYGEHLPSAYEQVAGAMMQDYLRDALGCGEKALALMMALAEVRQEHGKFAVLAMDKFGKFSVLK